MDPKNLKMFPPKKFPFKRNLIFGLLAYAGFRVWSEKNKYSYMELLREKNRANIEQSQQIQHNFSAYIKDFKGNPIDLDDKNYEYKMLYYGDFQTFFQLYTEELDNLKDYKIKNIFLTDSNRTKEIMDNVMKVQLQDTWYAHEEDKDIIKESGLNKDHVYYLNGDNEVISTIQVTPKDPMAAKNAIKLVKIRIRKDIDKKFLANFDFTTLPKKNE